MFYFSLKVNRAHKEVLEQQDQPVPMVQLDLLEQREEPEPLGQPVLQVQVVHLVPPVRLVLLEQAVLLELQVGTASI